MTVCAVHRHGALGVSLPFALALTLASVGRAFLIAFDRGRRTGLFDLRIRRAEAVLKLAAKLLLLAVLVRFLHNALPLGNRLSGN